MDEIIYLTLENGDVFKGRSFGEYRENIGEVVFTTAMTGYCETLTDKSYCGQIIVQAFPLIGNYGIIPEDYESQTIHASGYIVSDWCRSPSNFRSEGTLDTFLKAAHIPGVYGIDTRKLIKTIREHGVMNGKISQSPAYDEAIKSYRVSKSVEAVSVTKKGLINPDGRLKVAMFDFGYKENIVRELVKRDCTVTVFPSFSTADEILGMKPDGIMLTNGPGDPADNAGIINELKRICRSGIPVFGICLGHQLLALANGFDRERLKFGHRGANHPVKNLLSAKTYISSQNHGYAVVGKSISKDIAEELFVNVNDGTNEGIIYKHMSAFSVQFHPEGCGGPQDTNYLFDEFVRRIEDNKNA
jgi:carbamoyl-phosphate synthase small subunit